MKKPPISIIISVGSVRHVWTAGEKLGEEEIAIAARALHAMITGLESTNDLCEATK